MTAYAGTCTRVYTTTGRVAHLMAPHMHSILAGPVLCPVMPSGGEEWLGTGSYAEIAKATSLPLCQACARVAGADDARRDKAVRL